MLIPHRLHPALRDLVDRVQGYEYDLDRHAVHHGLPGPAATVIISFDEPLDVAWHDAPDTRVQRWLLASGLHTASVFIRTHGVQHGIQLDLTPDGCRVLLGVPLSALRYGLVDHRDLPTGIPDSLHARMAAADWRERFRLLEEHLVRLSAQERTPIPADLAYAWRRLAQTRGGLRVTELAGDIGWSRRHLVNRFTGEFGLPPRDIARLHRFGAALALARQGLAWGDVAARAGFADQSHLTREFRTLADQTPTQWRAEVFPVVSTGHS